MASKMIVSRRGLRDKVQVCVFKFDIAPDSRSEIS